MLLLLTIAACFAGAQEDDPAHLHGPDGRHIVAPQAGPAAAGSFILSHHDLRVEGPDGKPVLECDINTVITPKGAPADVIHREHNTYEPENEVYGSHMTYTTPGEYVASHTVELPDGKVLAVDFPVYVPAVGAADPEHAHGPNYWLIGLGVLGGVLVLFGVYRMGQKNARFGGAAVLMVAMGALLSLSNGGYAQEDDPEHLHGPDGRHIVAPNAEKSAGPNLNAFPAPNQGESAEKTVDGIRFVLSIENEVMTPDPDLVAIGTDKAELIGLKAESVEYTLAGGGLHTTGKVSADPDGLVVINARTSGRVVSLGALPGTAIRKGQVLAVIESPDLAQAQAGLLRANAEVAQAVAAVTIAKGRVDSANTVLVASKRNLDRQSQLAGAGAFASPPLEAAKSGVSKAEGDLRSAQTAVQSLEVRVRRLEQGVESGVVARRELEAAAAELQTARARLGDAQRQASLAAEALAREEAIAQRGLRNAREVEAARSEVDLAQSTLDSSRSMLVQSKADIQRTQSNVRIARDQIALLGGTPGGGNRVTITAPISGEVEHRTVSAGQTVAAGEMLYDLLNADVVWVLSDLFESDIPRVRVGQLVEVVADAVPGKTYLGEVAFIHNEVDPSSRTTKVRIVVDNPGEQLKQNMFVRVLFKAGSTGLWTVPTAAVQSSKGVPVVFVEVAPGTYRKTIVQVAGTLGNRTLIKSGLNVNQKVVTDGAYQLVAMESGQ